MSKFKFGLVYVIGILFACAAAHAAVCFLPNYDATDGSCAGDDSFNKGTDGDTGGDTGGEEDECADKGYRTTPCETDGYKNVQHGKCYECVARKCDDYGYQETQCADGKIQTTKTPKLGSTSGTCYLCEDASDATCASKYGAGYQSSACNTYYKSTNAKSDGCHQCAPMTCDEIGDGTYTLSSCTSETCPNGKERACHSQTFGETTCYYKDNETTCNDDNQLVCPPAGTRLRVEYHLALGLNNNYILANIDEQSPVDFEIVSTKGAYNYEINYKGQKVYETGNGGTGAHGLRFTGERNGELCAVEADKCLTGSYNYAMSDALKQEKENIGYLCDSCTDGTYTSYNCHCSDKDGGELSDGQCLHEIPVNSVVRNLDNLCTILGVSQNNEEHGCKKYSCWDLDKDNGVFSARVQYKVRNNSAWQSLPEKSFRLNFPTGTTNFEGAKIHIHSGKVQVSYTNTVSITGDSLGGGIDFGQNNNNGGGIGTLQPVMNSVSRISVYALDQKSADGGLQSDEETIENLLSVSKTNNICPVANGLTIAKGSVSVTLNTNDLIRAYTPVTSDGVTTQRYGVWGHTLTYYSFMPK